MLEMAVEKGASMAVGRKQMAVVGAFVADVGGGAAGAEYGISVRRNGKTTGGLRVL